MIYEGMVEERLSFYHNGISCVGGISDGFYHNGISCVGGIRDGSVGGIRDGKRLVCYGHHFNVVECDDYGYSYVD